MRQDPEIEENKRIIKERIPKKIDSTFIKRYFGQLAQIRLGLKDLDSFEDALLMNGLAGIDCRNIDFSELTQEEFECLPFDDETLFSEKTKEKFKPSEVLERGKQFGFGLAKIPLTGKGVHVAIMDENFDPYSIDANIADYTRVKKGKVYKSVNPEDTEHMHGKTTTSLLASKSCGVAKDALVHFFSGDVEKYFKYIVEHNRRCMEKGREEDKILVASGSWRIPKSKPDKPRKSFEECRDLLRSVGCELVCADNFDKNFGEVTSNGGCLQYTLEVSQDDLDYIEERFPGQAERIKMQLAKRDFVKIPISRTYHQVGEKGGFKHQSAYSTSWGIPQVAGLLAVFKELDKDLTFEELCEYARETALSEMKIINVRGIFEKVKERVANKNADTKGRVSQTSLDDDDGLR